MRKLFGITLSLFLSACSLYQSEGRKFLEKQAFEFAGVTAQAYQVTCQDNGDTQQWVELTQTPLARVYAHETGGFEMRVFPNENEHGFYCDYRFPSAQEMFERTTDAIDLTVSHAHAQTAH